jgi:hypothetical protein
MVAQHLLTVVIITPLIRAVDIWGVGLFMGRLPEMNASLITPKLFQESQQHRPFVVRGFHKTLAQIASDDGFTNDALEWMISAIGNETRMTSLEGELQETRLAPTIHRLKFKYFFEKYRDLDAYAVTQVPETLRRHLQLLPMLSCPGITASMQPPMMWISGGSKKSKSVIHDDSNHNQHCVLKGSKKFMLIPRHIPIDTPEYGWVVVDNEDGSVSEGFEDAYGEFAGRIDYNNVDIESFPKWKEVPWLLAELNEGDCLYMPIGWYHHVESEAKPTVTWHQWFRTPSRWPSECEIETFNEIFLNQCIFKTDDQVHRGLNTPSWSDDSISVCTERIN